MAVPNQDNGSNLPEVNQDGNITDDQTGGTPGESQSSEQGGGQPSGAFTGVDRATLTPDMQAMYDSMNGDYTQKNQALAEAQKLVDARRDFAAIGELVEQNPAINKLVWDAVAQQRSGQPSPEPIQPNIQPNNFGAGVVPQGDASPEELAGRAMISEEVMKVVGPLMQKIEGLTGPVGQMSTYMANNQAATEYQLLCQEFPSAATIRPQELQSTQLQYSRPGGGSITIREAFLLKAGENPALLAAKPNETPVGTPPAGGGVGGNTGPASIERGTTGTGVVGGSFRSPKGLAALRGAAQELREKAGGGSIRQAFDTARQKFNNAHPNQM